MFPARFFIIGLLACAISYSLASCPTPETINPCFCARSTIFCSNPVMTTTELQRVMRNLIKRGSFGFYLRNLNLGNMSLPIIRFALGPELKISDCKLESIIDNQSNEVNYGAKVVKITNSINDEKLNFKMDLLSLKRLNEIDLYHNIIRHVRKDLFALVPTTVTELALNDNRIETIEDGAFSRFSSLKSLMLEGNSIQRITRSILPPEPFYLHLLSLKSNKISFLPDDTFFNMHFLTSIDVSENNLAEFSERAWRSLWSHLEIVNAKDNPLVCDSRIEWMFKLRRPRLLLADCYGPDGRNDTTLSSIIDRNRPRSMRKKLHTFEFLRYYI